MKLRELAHSRTGDKGDHLTVSVIAYQAADYALLEAQITPERIKRHLSDRVRGPVVRYCLPHLHAVHFVLEHALRGGVTRSLALDAHGKCVSSLILDLEIETGR